MKKLIFRLTILIFTVFSSIGGTPSVSAADNSADADAQEIYGSVMSPFCPGRLLSDCPSGSASELKAKIHTQLMNGKTKEDVLKELYGTFGSTLRASPEAAGFGLFAWWMPVVFLVLGGGAIAWWLKFSQSSESTSPTIPQLSPELQSRVDKELQAILRDDH